MLSVTLSDAPDLALVGARWRELEALSAPPFFRGWTWVGCLAAERYPDPVLLEATRDGRTVALGLFNRHHDWHGRDTICLGENGSPERDSMWVEHNGLLIARGEEQALLEPCLRAAMASPGGMHRRRLVLSGVDAAHLSALRAHASIWVRRTETAMVVNLARLRATGADWLEGLSANTRYQIRRSDRRYLAAGDLHIRRAATVAEAHTFLDALGALHQTTWTRRGQLGSFASPFFRQFHRTLLARALPGHEAELLCVTAGSDVLGYLYNFVYRGRVTVYQTGFNYEAAGPHHKPGLTAHHLAIRMYRDAGMDCYDLLGGGAYKARMAEAEQALHWVEAVPHSSPDAIVHSLRRAARAEA